MPAEQTFPQLGRIYKITSPNSDKFYIGSTFLTVPRRFDQHVFWYEQFVKYGVGTKTYAHQVLSLPDCRAELIEEFMCNSRDELRQREAEVFREYRAQVVNKNNPYDNNDKRRSAQKMYQDKYRMKRRACPQCGYCSGTSSPARDNTSDAELSSSDPAEWACA